MTTSRTPPGKPRTEVPTKVPGRPGRASAAARSKQSARPARRRPSEPPAHEERQPLTRERIAHAALALIDQEGLEGCSMRRLGASLGVEAMALYHHFASKGELLDAVVEVLADQIQMPARGEVAPTERLRAAMRSYLAIARRHPRAFVLLATRRFNSERAFARYELVLQAFADLGLDPGQCAGWFRLLGNFASGSGLADIASREREPDATRLVLEHAPDFSRYPNVAAVAPFLQVKRLDAVVEFGFDVLFDALAAQAPAAATKRSGRTRRSS